MHPELSYSRKISEQILMTPTVFQSHYFSVLFILKFYDCALRQQPRTNISVCLQCLLLHCYRPRQQTAAGKGRRPINRTDKWVRSKMARPQFDSTSFSVRIIMFLHTQTKHMLIICTINAIILKILFVAKIITLFQKLIIG